MNAAQMIYVHNCPGDWYADQLIRHATPEERALLAPAVLEGNRELAAEVDELTDLLEKAQDEAHDKRAAEEDAETAAVERDEADRRFYSLRIDVQEVFGKIEKLAAEIDCKELTDLKAIVARLDKLAEDLADAERNA